MFTERDKLIANNFQVIWIPGIGFVTNAMLYDKTIR